MRHRPRKRFGQNFLHDPGVIARIVNAIAPRSVDAMIEIGPGLGALTGALLSHIQHLHVVELDRDLAAGLRSGPLAPRLTVHEMDALDMDLASPEWPPGRPRLRIVGNLPYNISSPLLFHLLEQVSYIQDMHFMLQKEVVARMSAAAGSRTYGRLSVVLQARCRVEALFGVGPGAFNPPPRVDSAVVRLSPLPDAPPRTRLAALQIVTTRAFAQRRKTLRNALRGVLDAHDMASLGIDPAARPESLEVSDFLALAALLESSPASTGLCG